MREVAMAALSATIDKPCGFQIRDQLSELSGHQQIPGVSFTVALQLHFS
jgi:hypothetical protein